MIKVSLFASSVRPQLYESFFKSLEGTSVEYEVVFAGHIDTTDDHSIHYTDLCVWKVDDELKYIKTENIKPSQCYEIARRHCQGEVVVWVADDCEFPNDVIGKAYRYWKEQGNEKLILSIQTKENGLGQKEMVAIDMNVHRLFGGQKSTPLMAPLGMMSLEYLEQLGGIDRRYICGQYENDIVMRVYADKGTVEIFGDENCAIEIDHLGKCGGRNGFYNRPFGQGYPNDRKVLETSWVKDHGAMRNRQDKFEPFEDVDLLTKSQSNNLPELWV